VNYESPDDFLARHGRFSEPFKPELKKRNGHANAHAVSGIVAFDERNPPIAGDAGAPSEDAELPVVSVADFADKPIPDRLWIVPGMIPDRTVTIVGGDGGDGKTTLLLQMCAAKAARQPWLGYSLEEGGSLFISAEDDSDELHRRMAAIAMSLGVKLSDLGDVRLVLLAGRDAVMGLPNKAGVVTATAIFHGLVALVKQLKPRVVILDALADVFGGEENARAQARQFIGLLRGLAIDHDLAVILIAHPSLTGMSTGSGSSGSTAWNNSVRSRLYLERVKGDDGREIDQDLRVLRVKKANYGPAGVELRLRWRNGAFVLDGPAGGFDRLAANANAERVFVTILQRFNRQGRNASDTRGTSYAPALFEKEGDAEGLNKRDLEAAMRRLFEKEKIHRVDHGRKSKPAWTLEPKEESGEE
jgi:RecA-family ATPase